MHLSGYYSPNCAVLYCKINESKDDIVVFGMKIMALLCAKYHRNQLQLFEDCKQSK